MKQSLLEKAKQQKCHNKNKTKYDQEDYEVAVALMNGEVTISQVSNAKFGIKGGGKSYHYAISVLSEGVALGKIKIELM